MLRTFTLFALVSLCGCGDRPRPAPTAEQVQATLFGQEVTLPRRPVRVLAGNVGTLELLLGLTDWGRIAAIPAEGHEYSALGLEPEELEGRPTFAVFDAESVLASNPDLVLASDWQALETCAAVASAGIPVLRVPTPASWEQLEGTLYELGRALGEEERAKELVASLAEGRRALAERTQALGPLRALVYSNYGAGGATSGKGTTWHMIFEAAGLHNAAADLVGHPKLDTEELLQLNPDLLVLSDDASGATTLAELGRLPKGSGLRPLDSGQIVHIPANLFSTSSQHMLDAAEMLVDRLLELNR